MNLFDKRNKAYTKKTSPSEDTFASRVTENSTKNTQDAKSQQPNDEATAGEFVKEVQKESVYRRVAKFLVIIGADEAAKVLPLLTDDQVQKIIPEISTVGAISEEEKAAILAEFQSLYKSATSSGIVPTTAGAAVAKEILEKVYGPEKAAQMLKTASPYVAGKPFAYLNSLKPQKVAALLNDESNATKCLILSNITPTLAASVINLMSDRDKKDIVIRLAKMQTVQTEILTKVDKAMFDKLQNMTDDGEGFNGTERLSEILKAMTPASGSDIINLLERDDKELGDALRAKLFTIEDVVNADDKYIQARLHSMQTNDIARLIIKKPEPFRQKILNCISKGRRDEVHEEEEYSTFLKSDCERVTNDFIMKLREDFEKGQLIVEGRNDDAFV